MTKEINKPKIKAFQVASNLQRTDVLGVGGLQVKKKKSSTQLSCTKVYLVETKDNNRPTPYDPIVRYFMGILKVFKGHIVK